MGAAPPLPLLRKLQPTMSSALNLLTLNKPSALSPSLSGFPSIYHLNYSTQTLGIILFSLESTERSSPFLFFVPKCLFIFHLQRVIRHSSSIVIMHNWIKQGRGAEINDLCKFAYQVGMRNTVLQLWISYYCIYHYYICYHLYFHHYLIKRKKKQ